jgi:hypothetical protein
MDKYLYRFTDISVRHKLYRFDKIILPFSIDGSEVWDFNQDKAVETRTLLMADKEDYLCKMHVCGWLYNLVYVRVCI